MVSQLEKTPISATQASPSPSTRGLTLRSLAIMLFALLLLGMWVEYTERYVFGGPLAENAPPNGVVAILLFVVAIGALLARFRKSLRITVAELIVIYTAMLVAAPLMTQGLWTRIFGLISAVPHNQDFRTYESLPTMLWPHGSNMIRNGRFDGKLNGFTYQGTDPLAWDQLKWRDRDWKCPVLTNTGGTPASLSYTINRYDKPNHEQLVPGEQFLFTCLVRTEDLAASSYYTISMQTDDAAPQTLLTQTTETTRSFTLPSGFARIGVTPVTIPAALGDQLTLSVALHGAGRLAVQDVQFLNIEAIEGAYRGRQVVREDHLGALKDNERDSTVVKPKNMWSLAGLAYLMTGFIPLQQWIWPTIAWALLIGALFLGFFGLNVLMRKQWSENEHLAFPLNILPRTLFGQFADATTQAPGESLWRNRVFWAGFGVAGILALLKGLQFYFPQIPALPIGDVWAPVSLQSYATDPLWRTYLQNVSISLPLTLLAIALLVETDVLFSVWVFFLLTQLWHVFGKAFNFTSNPGYPWAQQQHIGAFIAYALLAIFIGRRHLWQVARHLMGRCSMESKDEVVSYRTAALMVLVSLVALVGWGIWTGMGWKASLLFFGWMLICGLAASKIRAEVGMPFGYWMPYYGMLFVSAIGGFAVFGTTGMLVASLAAGFMCVACFLFIAPVQVEMMELGRQMRVRLKDIGAGLWIGLLAGVLIGGFTFLCWTYGKGADNFQFTWPYEQNWYLDSFRQGEAAATRAFLSGNLGHEPQVQAFNIVDNPDAKGITIGLGITLLLAALRQCFIWFPLHPLGYVLAFSSFAFYVWFTCFVAWLIRFVFQKFGGAHSVRKGLLPFAVGMFVACIVSVLLFELAGFFIGANGHPIYNKMP